MVIDEVDRVGGRVSAEHPGREGPLQLQRIAAVGGRTQTGRGGSGTRPAGTEAAGMCTDAAGLDRHRVEVDRNMIAMLFAAVGDGATTSRRAP